MAGAVRQPIDVEALQRYIGEKIPEIGLPLEVKQFGYGQSNPTYQLISPDGVKYVLRKKPPGRLLSKSAHKVEREYRIISALGPTDVPVPKAYCLCEDESVIGTAFYIMEFLDGRIFEDPSIPDASSAEERSRLWQAAVHTLAKLHRVDYTKLGLQSFGQTSGFYDRQLATWKQISLSQANVVDAETKESVGAIPHIDSLLAFFGDKANQPRDRATLVHGDYKIDNIVFHRDKPEVIGLLDWEMSTIGHPLSDLANMMNPYYMTPGFFPSDSSPGLPSPDALMGWYADVAGWDPRPEADWAKAFSIFRLSAIAQGIAARVVRKQASSAQAKRYATIFPSLGVLAWNMVEERRSTAGAVAKTKL
ncbi:putative kinase, aminoglycoside phosphotransferase (APT) family [Geosmithia morbida]|uniref:Kinase, aminoglycoside phosphotransferase (APT) family n=1 Tax=Geosmithia morbida TaxID=1094350 RepID=A0A9P4YU74_9HYPO|nr:putative kinase, aminoglycoside phosphotransferase (APT) family [Geosmithia morbida]KAF4122637.1 putative kinase, aminoglycoside phosphotransferase (APT) family [Geosmithia morbida]